MNHTFKLALAGALCAFPSVATACSCAPPPAPKIALQKSAAVFVGRVTSVEKSDFSSTYQFSVSKQWKGVEGKTASIVTATDSAACGIGFDEDRDYLVYAFKNKGDDQLRTNLCSRTKRAEGADAELAALGAPQAELASYPVSDNGVVQVGAGPIEFVSVRLREALQRDRQSQKFRLNWGYTANKGTALYNRSDSTLKVYYRVQTETETAIHSALYSGVTDKVLGQVAMTNYSEDPFAVYIEHGVTKKDFGSKTVLLPR